MRRVLLKPLCNTMQLIILLCVCPPKVTLVNHEKGPHYGGCHKVTMQATRQQQNFGWRHVHTAQLNIPGTHTITQSHKQTSGLTERVCGCALFFWLPAPPIMGSSSSFSSSWALPLTVWPSPSPPCLATLPPLHQSTERVCAQPHFDRPPARCAPFFPSGPPSPRSQLVPPHWCTSCDVGTS